MGDLGRYEDLPRAREAAQPGSEVQGAAAKSLLDGHRLACVEPDPDEQGKLRLLQRLIDEPPLQIDGRHDRLARRVERREGLVASKLDHPSAVGGHPFPNDLREPLGQPGGCLVAVLLRERRVSPDVGDEEHLDPAGFALRLDRVGAQPTSSRSIVFVGIALDCSIRL